MSKLVLQNYSLLLVLFNAFLGLKFGLKVLLCINNWHYETVYLTSLNILQTSTNVSFGLFHFWYLCPCQHHSQSCAINYIFCQAKLICDQTPHLIKIKRGNPKKENELERLRRHASQVHFAKIHLPIHLSLHAHF